MFRETHKTLDMLFYKTNFNTHNKYFQMKRIAQYPVLFLMISFFMLIGCGNDDDDMMTTLPDVDPPDNPVVVEQTTTYELGAIAVPNISGKAVFKKNSDNTVTIDLELSNTPAGGQHPAHIHMNSAVEGGAIALTLGPVDGSTGSSSVTIAALDNGTAITYEQLLNFDGYINVHLSADELGTIVAQGDIGENALTGMSKEYNLSEKAAPGIEGSVIFYERENGEALSVIQLMNTPENGNHPAHIHNNSAIEGGGIALTFNPIDGNTGMSKTNISQLDDGSIFGYNNLLEFDGYINVHLSPEELSVIVAQGDIGNNELTDSSVMYMFGEKDVPGISGMVTFFQRKSNETLALLELMNTPQGGVHPAHIHNNSAIEGGGIAVSFTPVDGTTGMSYTQIEALDDGTAVSYNQLLDFDGYVNVHLSADELSTIVAQGDIGQNELTGMSVVYDLGEKDVPGISGMATFYERKSGEALAILKLSNTPENGVHPAHIHNNDAATGGGIAFSFNPVDGTSGMSATHVGQLDDGTSFGYSAVQSFNGYINVHLSPDDLSTIVAQGNIGSNENNGGGGNEAVSYSVSNNGNASYIFTGEGFNNEANPDFTFKRGATYEFNINTPGHPFYIKTSQTLGTGDTYDVGVTNNGAVSGTITFTVPMDAPDTLYYICEFHNSMAGTINIVD